MENEAEERERDLEEECEAVAKVEMPREGDCADSLVEGLAFVVDRINCHRHEAAPLY